MKIITKSLLSLAVATSLYGGGWEDILKGSNSDGVLLDDGNTHTVSLYNASLTYTVVDNDGISGNFDGSDTAIVTLTSNGKTITSGATALSKEDLKTWAKANADAIIQSVFNGDPSSSLGGQNTATSTSENVVNILSSISTKSKKRVKEGLSSFNSRTMMNSETLSIKDKNKNIDGSSGIITYSKEMKSGNSWGLITTYRNTEADDTMKSKTANLSFTPFYKVENRVDEKWNIPVLFNLTGSLVYLESSIFPDGAGYLEYGGGIGVLPTYEINEKLLFTSSLGYQYLKKDIPSSYVPEDAEWVADAIKALEALQVLNYGVGLQYDIIPNLKLDLNLLQVKHLKTENIETGRESATYYSTSGTYNWQKWSLSLGYKTVQGVSDYSEDTYMASLSYKW
jgi:hypothetical protein